MWAKCGKRHAKFHLNLFIVSPSRDEKPQFWANVDIWGAPVTSSLYLLEQIWHARVDRLDQLMLSHLNNGKLQILPFLNFGVLWCRLLAAYDES